MIARAAEGSVRDSLSIFDQAIAHSAGPVTAETVRGMLGLADRARVIDLFEHVMKGDMAAALAEFRAQYDTGADPATVLTDLADFTHFVTRLRYVPAAAGDASLTEDERKRGAALADTLSIKVLSRAWQMLLKGITEVQSSNRPVAAAEMVSDPAGACRRPADARRGDEDAGRRIAAYDGQRRRADGRVPGARPGSIRLGAIRVAIFRSGAGADADAAERRRRARRTAGRARAGRRGDPGRRRLPRLRPEPVAEIVPVRSLVRHRRACRRQPRHGLQGAAEALCPAGPHRARPARGGA